MKPDTPPARDLDRIERAHLRDPADTSHVIHRYDAPDDLAELVHRFWVPVWSVPPGREAPQRVLQYPVALVVVTAEYARFYGVSPGTSSTTLVGDGWGVGVLFRPAAGFLLAGTMAAWTGRHGELADVLGADAGRTVDAVRRAMAPDPTSPDAHRAATGAVADRLRRYLPVDDEGRVVNRVVEAVESDPGITRVAHLSERFGTGERALQRLARRRLGISPKWLIQRRRLHEAAERLQASGGSLADVAAELGYADQAHLTRDFRRVTGMTPGEFASRFG